MPAKRKATAKKKAPGESAGPKPLQGRVALVAGATRGVGRGIACMLGEAGAVVYCTGRSVRGSPATPGRPETIEETAEMVNRFGGRGVAVQVDHTREEQVRELIVRVRSEEGRLDVLVNDLFGPSVDEWRPFWKLSIAKGLRMLENALHSHIITSRHAVPLMLERKRGLVVEITDGDLPGYRQQLFFDLANFSKYRLAYAMAIELRKHGITALALTPGYTRTEAVLDHWGVTEANWQDGAKKDPHFISSETPFYVGRAVAALAADPKVAAKSGRVLTSWGLAEEYGFSDLDGRQPHWDRYMKEIDHPYFRGAKRFDDGFYEYWGGLSGKK
jgi:NAD(P)-dependent dehydrogenase (short-subunit alcohol dehydrogenase family)